MDKVEIARMLCMCAHYGQKDKGGLDYYNHPARVASECQKYGEHYEIVGYLHDVLEDSRLIRLQGIEDLFGKGIADALYAITRQEDEKYFDYIRRCSRNEIARVVKIEDIKHNAVRSRWPDMPDGLIERGEKALKILEKPTTEGEGA